ncbi:MAG: hypothetical protein ACI9Y8_001336 [Candidatus Omnitrophota bacterium]
MNLSVECSISFPYKIFEINNIITILMIINDEKSHYSVIFKKLDILAASRHIIHNTPATPLNDAHFGRVFYCPKYPPL